MNDEVLRIFDAGEVVSNVYYVTIEDVPRSAIQLVFSPSVLWLSVNIDTDEIIVGGTHPEHLDPKLRVTEQEPWRAVIGKRISWAWSLTNQQGYRDGVQFEFKDDSGVVYGIQLVGVASSIWVYRMLRVE